MRSLVVLLTLLLFPSLAHAAGPATEIKERYDALTDAQQDALGGRVGGVVTAGPGGSKQLFQNGAIYYREDVGPVLVDPLSWARYGKMEAQSLLGFPIDERSGQQQRFENGALAGAGTKQFVVRGVLLGVWEKNNRVSGPLGAPTEDSDIDTMILGGGPIPFPITTAVQSFQGGKLDYSQLRLMGGQDAWIVTVKPATTRRVRAQLWAELGSVTSFCDVHLDRARWVHLGGGAHVTWEPTDDDVCEDSGDDRQAQMTLEVSLDSDGDLRVELQFWGYRWHHHIIEEETDHWPAVGASAVLIQIGRLLADESQLGDRWGSMLADKVGFEQRSIKVSDIKL